MQHDYILTVHVSGDPETNTWTIGRIDGQLTDNTPEAAPDTGPEDYVQPVTPVPTTGLAAPVPDPDAATEEPEPVEEPETF